MLNQSVGPSRQRQEYLSFVAELSAVTGKIHYTTVRNAFIVCLGPAATWLCYVSIVYVALRATTFFPRLSDWAALAGVAAVGTVVGVKIFAVWKRSPDLDDVAERLDLATNASNLIATAVSLSREENQSPFEKLAIRKGCQAISLYGTHDPVVRVESLFNQRTLERLGISALLLAAGVFPPAWSVAIKQDRSDLKMAPRDLVRQSQRTVPSKSADELPADIAASNSLDRLAEAVKGSKIKAPSGASDVRSDSGQSAGSSAVNASGARAVGEQPPTNADESEPMRDVGEPPASKADSSAASDARGDHGAARAASTGGPAQSSKGVPNTGSLENKGGVAAPVEQPPPSDELQTSIGQVTGPKSKKPANSGEGLVTNSGLSLLKGSGRTGGDDILKKSRGVAPFMLGTPQPDLLTSRQLVGPDARTDLKVPPPFDPQSPTHTVAADAIIERRTFVDECRLPAQARQAVSQYFELFHQTEKP